MSCPAPTPSPAGHCPPPRAAPAKQSTPHQCPVCRPGASAGNAIPGSTIAITLLAAPFIKAGENWIKAVYAWFADQGSSGARRYGNPVRGFLCRAGSGHGRPRSEEPAPACLPAGREPMGARPGSPLRPHPTRARETTETAKRRAGMVKGERSAGVTPPRIATTAARQTGSRRRLLAPQRERREER